MATARVCVCCHVIGPSVHHGVLLCDWSIYHGVLSCDWYIHHGVLSCDWSICHSVLSCDWSICHCPVYIICCVCVFITEVVLRSRLQSRLRQSLL